MARSMHHITWKPIEAMFDTYRISYLRIMAFTSVMVVPVLRAGDSPIDAPARVVADSVAEFSDKQGKNGWYYGYWDRAHDKDGKYAPGSEFILLEHFGQDSRNGLSRNTAFKTGDLWYLSDGQFYTSLWAKGGHANSSAKLGDYKAAEHWAVRRWISNVSGIVSISGKAGKEMPWGGNWGGECRALIIVDGETVLSTVMDEHNLDYMLTVKVQENSVVDFLIAPDPSIGVVTFTATIQERPKDRNR